MDVSFTERELDVMAILWDKGSATVAEVREVTAYSGNVGGGIGAGGGDTSFIIALLKPKIERTRSSSQIADELRQTLPRGMPGAMLPGTRQGMSGAASRQDIPATRRAGRAVFATRAAARSGCCCGRRGPAPWPR